MHLNSCRLVDLPKIEDPRGNLSFVEEGSHIPFSIERVYWIYDVPGGETRGGHAVKKQQEMIVSLSGSFDVVVDDGTTTKRYHLNRSYFGLYIPAGFWRQMEDFSTNSLAMVLSSTRYDEQDYIRDHEGFLAYKKNSQQYI